MDGLYPIIRRQRRTLLPPEELKPVVNVAAEQTVAEDESPKPSAKSESTGEREAEY